jgi:RNA-directed DNA polymerase
MVYEAKEYQRHALAQTTPILSCGASPQDKHRYSVISCRQGHVGFSHHQRSAQHLDQHLVAEKLSAAFDWLCKARESYPASSDIWQLRRSWHTERQQIKRALLNGSYRLDTQIQFHTADGQMQTIWRVRDALVLKAVALTLAKNAADGVFLHTCKGPWWAQGAVNQTYAAQAQHKFFCRTDVKSYYASIDHDCLLDLLAQYVTDNRLRNLQSQYLRRTVEYGGTFRDIHKGISSGCPLGPLMGGF